MATFRIPGYRVAASESKLPCAFKEPTVRSVVRVEPSIRDGALERIEADADDLLEIELDNGFVLWTTLEQFLGDAELGGTRGSDDRLLPARYPSALKSGTRGIASAAIRFLKVLDYDLPKGGALTIADALEGGLEGDGEFFGVSEEGALSRSAPVSTDPASPSLLLIHGTASATTNAFGGLFDQNRLLWRKMHAHYGGRVYGFEHRTLTLGPAANAIQLLRQLPEGAALDLVTHSRGGLVGDLLALGEVSSRPFGLQDLKTELRLAYGGRPEALKSEAAIYEELNELLLEKRPRIGRFVRVGCPASGTTLASRRLDFYLSVFVHLAGAIPGAGPFLGGFGDLVAAVAKERTKVETLPGLEAQMPTSPLVRLLQRSGHELKSNLTVVAGDSEGFVKNLANLFFATANDLVVDTRSMYGGVPRRNRFWHLEENRDVTHTNYFSRAETARVVWRGLSRHEDELSDFATGAPERQLRGHVDIGRPEEHTELPAVVLLPGIMGSHLSVSRGGPPERVWFDVSDLIKGRGRLLEIGNSTVEADGVLRRPYDDLRDYLAGRGLHVMPFAFDWRRSLQRAASELDSLLTERLEASDAPTYLLAHSMGGLVASLLLRRHRGTWERLLSRGGRLVQVGTPNQGSFVIARILRGEEKVLRQLAKLDLANGRATWTKMVSQFPGLLEMAPTFDQSIDLFTQKGWKQIKAHTLPSQDSLTEAAVVATDLAAQACSLGREVAARSGSVVYVAGGPAETPVYDARAQQLAWTRKGDGRVTWDSGIPNGVPTWFLQASHGSLLNQRQGFGGLRELLTEGTTQLLSQERPTARAATRAAEPSPPLGATSDGVSYLPSVEDLEEAALGMDADPAGASSAISVGSQCEISVVHGDLRYSSDPIMVGHYRGDPIVSAESVLDDCLGGALRSFLGAYPGEIGSAEAILRHPAENRAPGPPGAVVLGLGDVGELTPGRLEKSLEAALLRYAQALRDRGRDTSAMRLSSLLIGSGEAGLSMAQLVDTFLGAIARTNQALAESTSASRPGNPPFFKRLELIELYEDTALEALNTLREHARFDAAGSRALRIDLELVRRAGGRKRVRAAAPNDWWLPLSIRTESSDGDSAASRPVLRFTSYGERARAAEAVVEPQGPLIDRLLERALADGAATSLTASQTLFELLVPNAFKAAAADRNNISLVLDPGSAAYPWELLVDRMSNRVEPLGVGGGLIRQLRVDVSNAKPPEHSASNLVLVVGDPPSRLPRLPGAEREAQDVAGLLEGRWEVRTQIRGTGHTVTAESITEAIQTTDPRILHLAGHGVYDPSDPGSTGMVIGSRDLDGKLLLLSAGEVSQMRPVPELVFVNCCHLGRIEETPVHRLAANLATQFIRSGAKAVVAAGWPVDDSAAAVFARTFYSEILSGTEFGIAVKRARQRTHEQGGNTWAAYQCYGEPGYRLLADRAVRARSRGALTNSQEFLDSSELRVELENLRVVAGVEDSTQAPANLHQQAESLEAVARSKQWLREPGVLVGLARLYGETADLTKSLELYAAAEHLESGEMNLRDLEQRANFSCRQGQKLAEEASGGPDLQRAKEMVEQGLAELQLLVRHHGATSERLSLIASAHKRLAMLTDESKALRKELVAMTLHYSGAAGFRASNWYYPATGALLGVLLCGGPWARAATVRKQGLAKAPCARLHAFDPLVEELHALLSSSEPKSFWDAMARSELELMKAISEGDLSARRDQLAKDYRDTINLFASRRQLDSVATNVKFLCHAASVLELRTAGKPGTRSAVRQALRLLLEEILRPTRA